MQCDISSFWTFAAGACMGAAIAMLTIFLTLSAIRRMR